MKSNHWESIVYFLLTIVAVALMGYGWHVSHLGGVLYAILGTLIALIGFIIGMILYGDRWEIW